MMRRFLILFLFSACILESPCCLWAKDAVMGISVDKKVVEVGDAIQLSLSFDNGQKVPALDLPAINSFKSQYLGPSTMMSIINGQVSSSITHRYLLVAVKTGTFKVGPLAISYKGIDYKSEAIEIQVVSRGQLSKSSPGNSVQPQAQAQTEEELKERIFLAISVPDTRVYLNERVPVTVKLYVNQLEVRDIQYPEILGTGFMQDGFVNPRQSRQYRDNVSGILYDIIEFNTYAYFTRDGEITLGPAKLKCNLLIRESQRRRGRGIDDLFSHDFFDDSFFSDMFGRSRIYPLDLTSAQLAINVSSLPEDGRPQQFSGAIGSFKMQVEAEPRELKAGDPITLTFKIAGDGNFDSVNCPRLDSEEGFKAYQPQARTEDGVKIFEQVIMPESEKITEIPKIKFAYFNPQIEKYILIEEGPFPIRVAAQAEDKSVVLDASQIKQILPQKTQVLGRDIIYIKEEAGAWQKKGDFLHLRTGFLIFQLLPLSFLFISLAVGKRRERLSADVHYARKLRAPKIARAGLARAKRYLKNNKTKEFYDVIFKTLQEYLGHRFSRASAGITAQVVDELIESKNLDAQTADKLKNCFLNCDTARYAVSQDSMQTMQKTLAQLEEIIDNLERRKRK